jgi:hypothetical protein
MSEVDASPIRGRTYACGVDAEAEDTCDRCPDPDQCIDRSYDSIRPGVRRSSDDPNVRLLRAAREFLDAHDGERGKRRKNALAELRDAVRQAGDPYGYHLRKVTDGR